MYVLVKDVIYIICQLIFAVSIFNIIYSIKNKNKKVSKYIVTLSIIYILYSIIDISILPNLLHLDIGFEILIFYAILIISDILFITSIIVAVIKIKKLNNIGDSIKYKIVFVVFVIFPIFMFSFSYFKEMNYINNSELILVCSEGYEFNEEDFAYAISDDYSKKITIGADFRGYAMEKYLPSSFHKLGYTWTTDKIKIGDDNITIFRNDKIIYKINLVNSLSYCEVEEVFLKQ